MKGTCIYHRGGSYQEMHEYIYISHELIVNFIKTDFLPSVDLYTKEFSSDIANVFYILTHNDANFCLRMSIERASTDRPMSGTNILQGIHMMELFYYFDDFFLLVVY